MKMKTKRKTLKMPVRYLMTGFLGRKVQEKV